MTTNTTPAIVVDFSADDTTLSAAYVAADVSGKAAMRAAADVAITDAIKAGDIAAATRAVHVRDNVMKAAAKSAATPVDYVAKVADIRATLVAAIDAIDAHDIAGLPDGFTFADDVDFTGGTADEKAVRAMTTVTARKAGRGNVADFIASVVGDVPMKVSAMRAAWSPSADYPKAPPSAGAIGACLDRDDDDRFIVTTDADGNKAAIAA